MFGFHIIKKLISGYSTLKRLIFADINDFVNKKFLGRVTIWISKEIKILL